MTRLNVHLYRDSFNTPWGFRLQGGKDLNQALTVQRVFSNSPAEGELQRGDNILSINGRDTSDLTHKQAQDYIKHGGGQIQLIIHRPPPGTFVAPLSPPIVTVRPRAPSLQDTEIEVTSLQHPMDKGSNIRVVPISTADSPSYHSPSYPTSAQYNASPSYSTMNGDPYHGYRPQGGQTSYKSKPTYLQIQVNPPSHQRQQQHHNQPQHHQQQQTHKQPLRNNQHQQYYLQQLQQKQQRQPARYRSSFSQPPVTPTTPTPPWASQQENPKRVSKLSQLGGGVQKFGTDFATLPRSASAKHGPASHLRRRDSEQLYNQDDLEREPEIELATGPVPRVCSRRNLGGGGRDFGTAFGGSSTLPRRQDRRSSQPPSLPSQNYAFSPSRVPASPRYGGAQSFGTDYNAARPGQSPYGQTPHGQTPAQRVQSTLDNITLSPRTPEALQVQPVFQPYTPQPMAIQPQPVQQPYQPAPQLSPRPQQVYTPTSLLLEQQQRMQQQQQPQQYHGGDEGEEDEIAPVWERRRMFQQIDALNSGRPSARTPVSPAKPYPPKPTSFSPGNKYATYSPGGQSQQSNAVWRPAQPAHNQPYSPGHQAPALSHAAPPPWKRPDDEVDSSTPAWRSTLKSASGVKPWERDIDYQQQLEEEAAPRSVPYNSGQNQAPGGGKGGPKVVHLQYNSPMGLYSSQNVADTYASHAQLASPGGEAPKANKAANDQAGNRDWSQSAVLRFLDQESKRAGNAPRVAAKPAPPQHNAMYHSPAPAHQMQQAYFDDAVGCSDF